MARIVYQPASIGGKLLATAVDHISQAQYLIGRAKSMADAASAGGATPAMLEGGTEFGVGSGAGSTFYTALQALRTNVNTVTAASIADLDMGT